MKLYEQIELNIAELESRFRDCGDYVKRQFPVHICGKEVQVYIAYLDMMIDREMLERSVILQMLTSGEMATAEVSVKTDFETVQDAILSADAAVFIDGAAECKIISAKGFPNRGVGTADTEVVVQGSKEAFSEVFRVNTMLIRRRVRDTALKIKQYRVGRRSGTDVALVYMEGIARESVVLEATRRLQAIDIDAVMDAGYIEQLIEDDHISPFPQIQTTERPDKAAASILEGRVVIIVDNSPFALIIPATMNTFFQASDDYYQRFEIMSFTRILRYFCGFLALALPGLYLAAATFHPSMLPLLLTLKMAEARALVPFPALLEILIMEFAFELLREAGVRLPGAVGPAIGIVGGLIVGSAAVEAGVASPVVVIIIALTGIAGFAVPHYSLSAGFRLTKLMITVFSAVLGFLGFCAGFLILAVHLCSLTSFGVPYLFPFAAGDMNGHRDLKDTIVRAPTFMMRLRPFFARPGGRRRMR